MTIEEAAASVGRSVIYSTAHPALPAERGVITSVSDRFAFVRYGADLAAKATNPEDLTLEFSDAKLEAVSLALRERPLEERVPGYGHGGMSAWEKSELLAYLNDED